MIKEAIATGKTVDAAIEAACSEIGLSRGEVEIEVIDLPKRGFLGLTNTPAKVRAYAEVAETQQAVKEPCAARQEAGEAPAAASPNLGKKAEVAVRYVTDIIHEMGLEEANISHTVEGSNVILKLDGDVMGVAIGRRGETLDALQYLSGLAANRIEGDYARVIIDSGNYREKRKQTLEQLARKLANNAVRTGRSTTLEPMNPYERRIIHAAVSQIEGAASTSVGEEPNRCVVVSSTNPRPQRPAGSRPPRRNDSNRPPRREGAPVQAGGERREGGDRREGSSDRPYSSRPPRRDGRRDGGRREKPEPYKESSKREIPPSEAENKPLYGKIDL